MKNWFVHAGWPWQAAIVYLAIAAWTFSFTLGMVVYEIVRRREPYWAVWRLSRRALIQAIIGATALMAATWPLLALPAFNRRHNSLAQRIAFRLWPPGDQKGR